MCAWGEGGGYVCFVSLSSVRQSAVVAKLGASSHQPGGVSQPLWVSADSERHLGRKKDQALPR